ncbi:MAG: hypothetical protein NTZ38_00320 [Candidatus Taylorbacteria bacterium]|nr:hypothetical protein [Candidatus Taylorbacteria bacterium]
MRKSYGKIIVFYERLYLLIANETFSEMAAADLVAHFNGMFEIVGHGLSIEEFTLETARKAHDDYNVPGPSHLEMTGELAEHAFEDLAPFFRDPRAQILTEHFRAISGTGTSIDLYVQIRNVRFVGSDESGPAVVTLVVDSFDSLQHLLSSPQDGGVEYSHLSYGENVPEGSRID